MRLRQLRDAFRFSHLLTEIGLVLLFAIVALIVLFG